VVRESVIKERPKYAGALRDGTTACERIKIVCRAGGEGIGRRKELGDVTCGNGRGGGEGVGPTGI